MGSGSEMQYAVIPFREMLPDLGMSNNPGMMEVRGLVPYGTDPVTYRFSGNASQVAILEANNAAPTAPTGLCINSDDGTNPDYAYIGFDYAAGISVNNIRQVNLSTGVVTAVGHAASNPVVAANGWQFTQFGSQTIAVPGRGSLPWIQLTPGAAFINLHDGVSADAPWANFVAQFQDRIFLANLGNVGAGSSCPDYPAGSTLNPNAVWWSVTNEARRFGTESTFPTGNTGFQLLYDEHGPITALAGGKDFMLVFKRRAIYRATWGGAFRVEFVPLPVAFGCLFPNSIVRIGNDVFFWSSMGPAVYRGDQVTLLARGKVELYLNDPIIGKFKPGGGSRPYVMGCYLPGCDSVLWAYPGNASFPGRATRAILYHIPSGSFTSYDFTKSFLPVSPTGFTGLLGLASTPPSMLNAPLPLEGAYAVCRTDNGGALAGCNLVRLASTPGLNLGCVLDRGVSIRTAQVSPAPGQQIVVHAIRPLFGLKVENAGWSMIANVLHALKFRVRSWRHSFDERVPNEIAAAWNVHFNRESGWCQINGDVAGELKQFEFLVDDTLAGQNELQWLEQEIGDIEGMMVAFTVGGEG